MMIGIKEAAERLGVSSLYLRKIIDVGDVVPSVVNRHDGELWHKQTEILFSESDLKAFAAEIRERRFHHVFAQHGYVVLADAKFACGKGWERVIRELATGLGAIPGPPPRLTGGKEKFGSFVAFVSCEDDQREAANALCEAARKKSLTICEECGGPARLRMGHGRCLTLCDRHSRLTHPLRDHDGEIIDLRPTGGPIYRNGQQGE
ncbi:hypothetical protein CN198_14240 [Sinorhizobium meliloti]|uniref:hypothetical protein n=1 Tax=Rhizobium meliloti TaxID=382 RepID=UPI000FD8A64D|nr:hypothetical protein [Sinorhizobium meliloti]RVH69215.1 hypothetical protein CN198_14240 [Sinorhizobium meliloti]